MKRRDLLTAAPVAALTAALCAGDVAAATEAVLAETPVMRLFREWKAAVTIENDAYAADNWGESEECAKASADRSAATLRLIQGPTQTDRDLLLKIIAATDYGQFGTEMDRQGDLWAEARALVGEA